MYQDFGLHPQLWHCKEENKNKKEKQEKWDRIHKKFIESWDKIIDKKDKEDLAYMEGYI